MKQKIPLYFNPPRLAVAHSEQLADHTALEGMVGGYSGCNERRKTGDGRLFRLLARIREETPEFTGEIDPFGRWAIAPLLHGPGVQTPERVVRFLRSPPLVTGWPQVG